MNPPTTYTRCTRRDDPNAGGNHRKSMVRVPDADLLQLTAVSAVDPAFPHEFLKGDVVRHIIYGDTDARARPRRG